MDLIIDHVAPLAGAWIETRALLWTIKPSRVAPLAGAWIETTDVGDAHVVLYVAPLAGAWIETAFTASCWAASSRRTPRGCVD